ncbi:branched-chain amino acid ABC transporter substrate-binding protein [Aminobacter carboxidus]|uniref:Branched-chain amino acid ABC transporter substrate-binding protein n=1 Tax=Aminobacter carboxidus TaxID=376165 RepID=A0ABR9GJ40_9HYPH|nr:branched-chain amino acid ABC transporter substrate-binding protein [Aminobacter carboxidus]MBE1203640.1 branched-chain amino acid ABC transporter substrate-binding protein [Aminobacter carboxidus]
MRAATAITTLLAASLTALAAHAEPVKIGVAAPLSGPSALLGEQVKAGAQLAAAKGKASLVVADDRCTAEGGAKAAQSFVDAKVSVATGFLCTEAAEAALPVLKNANIPVITVGVRTDSLTDLRDKTGWQVFRLGPRGDGERNAAASILTRLWNDELFAIVDDGTIYGRELAESFRASAEQVGLKPVFFDTYRPQLDNQVALIGRLRKAGATHVFVGGDGEDIAVMGRDAASLGVDIVFAGGETLRSADRAVPPAEGTLMIAPPEWPAFASPEVRATFEAAKTVTDGYGLPGYAAVEIASAAARLASSNGKPVADALTGRAFDTAIGKIRFDAKGDLAENPFRLFRFDGTNYLPVETQ